MELWTTLTVSESGQPQVGLKGLVLDMVRDGHEDNGLHDRPREGERKRKGHSERRGSCTRHKNNLCKRGREEERGRRRMRDGDAALVVTNGPGQSQAGRGGRGRTWKRRRPGHWRGHAGMGQGGRPRSRPRTRTHCDGAQGMGCARAVGRGRRIRMDGLLHASTAGGRGTRALTTATSTGTVTVISPSCCWGVMLSSMDSGEQERERGRGGGRSGRTGQDAPWRASAVK